MIELKKLKERDDQEWNKILTDFDNHVSYQIVKRTVIPLVAQGIDPYEELKDIKQEVWLMFWNYLDRTETEAAIPTQIDWCTKIVCENYLRFLDRHYIMPESADVSADQPDRVITTDALLAMADMATPEKIYLDRESLERVERVLKKLPQEWEIVFNRYLNGTTQRAIAKEMKMSHNYVRLIIFRIRSRLKQIYE